MEPGPFALLLGFSQLALAAFWSTAWYWITGGRRPFAVILSGAIAPLLMTVLFAMIWLETLPKTEGPGEGMLAVVIVGYSALLIPLSLLGAGVAWAVLKRLKTP